MVFLPKLMFDPLFVKFFPENKIFFENAVYIGKTWKSCYIMAMKILKLYTKDEVISELLEKCPILRYRNEDDKFYEMIYYGDLPLFTNGWEKVIAPFIRLYYNTKMKSFCYKARIGMEEKQYVCNLWSTEHVIEQFKEDIEKIKDFKMKQKINKIKEDF